MEELEKICCTEAERTQQLRVDDLSRQELQESQSTLNQLTVQIQEVQDKANSLNESRGFHDPETASSSGLSHVPSHPMIVPSSSGGLAEISARSLIHGTHMVRRETFFENPSPSDEPTASCSRNVYARSPTTTHTNLCF